MNVLRFSFVLLVAFDGKFANKNLKKKSCEAISVLYLIKMHEYHGTNIFQVNFST